ncbi:hypothetical protein [Natronococcus sp. A-GB7]|uniref:hypothetical protein n=1 Tax=Natronococcus sp. A-GB7 TaxID=3037649 RepID=UPI00241DA26C|nr:hypothetical protein [Natronococcus sp. A-GB7]MDG5821734.1 hypothetical protein [Natronococcus sp. A-GB7]
MSEGLQSERASPTETVGYAYRAGSRRSRAGADPVAGPETVVCDDVADGDRSQIGGLVPIRERTRSEAGLDHLTEVTASDDG